MVVNIIKQPEDVITNYLLTGCKDFNLEREQAYGVMTERS